MLMLKDNHIDRAGSIVEAVNQLRRAYSPCPPIEVECRTLDEVREATGCGVDRIMLDNMDAETTREALGLIPESIETELSGGVSLENIREIAELGPNYISVGRLTHSCGQFRFQHAIRAVTIKRNIVENAKAIISEIRDAMGDSLCILGHHYQSDEVIDCTDIRGDSLELARKINGLKAEHIVFCGVFFMAESAAILSRPGQKIHIPDPTATCPHGRHGRSGPRAQDPGHARRERAQDRSPDLRELLRRR